jgi:uncharacterized protein
MITPQSAPSSLARLGALALAALLAGLAPQRLRAEPAVPDSVRLTVAPGIELLTLVHRPAGTGPHPVLLVRTPYRTRGGSTAWLAAALVPHGYAVIEQDARGTGGSGGDFVPFLHDVSDGVATLDWLAAQPWAGPVGLWGISYSGWNAYALAATGHPAVRALAVGSGWADMERFLFPGGAFHLEAHLAWLLGFAGGHGLPGAAEFRQAAATLPLRPLLGPGDAVLAHAATPFPWHALSAPVLHFTGWWDYVYPDALHAWHALRALRGTAAHHATQRLIVGAWAHNGEKTGQTRVADVDYGPAAAAGLDSVAAWTRRFFDVQLRGLPSRDPPVRIFVMGENRWREFPDWPPPAARTRTWYLAAGDRLVSRPPRRTHTTTFHYDPAHPMPTLGGANSHFFPATLGPLDQAPLDDRSDVARFLSAPLPRPLVLAGPLRAILFLDADAPATDVVVRLVAVAPDGTARLVEEGIRRIPRLRPGINEATIELGERALRLATGSRLRIDVTGGSFPRFDRNPNTGDDPLDAATLRPVRVALRHGRRQPARIELTTLPY